MRVAGTAVMVTMMVGISSMVLVGTLRLRNVSARSMIVTGIKMMAPGRLRQMSARAGKDRQHGNHQKNKQRCYTFINHKEGLQ